jgi:P27 family predicted phage terminase small subunit
MGRRGRPPEPTKLRLLKGETRPCRINDKEPIPRDAPPEPPKGMDPAVREIWDYTLRELQAMGVACAADRDTLRCYCEAVVAHRKASEVLAKTAILVRGMHGNMVRNPALQIQRDAAHVVRAFAQEFGLTPSGRTRIQTDRNDSAGSNPFAVVS